MKKTSAIFLILFSVGLFFLAGLSSRGGSSGKSPASIAPPPPPTVPLPPLPAPPLNPLVQTLSHRDQALIQRLTPRVEIWRPDSNHPQVPARRSDRGNSDKAFVTGTEPVTVRLKFNPQSAGEQVTVIAARGIVLNPPQQVLTLSAQGDCSFQAQLVAGASQGHLITYCRNVRTVVPLARAPLSVVQGWEEQTGGHP